MAIDYMTTNNQTNKVKGQTVWEFTQDVAAGNGDSILVPNEAGKISTLLVTLIPNGGTGKIQHTISSLSDVIAGTANWVDWDAGTVSVNSTDAFYFVTAVRLVRTTGTPTIEVRAY